jgi:hypothetical protein
MTPYFRGLLTLLAVIALVLYLCATAKADETDTSTPKLEWVYQAAAAADMLTTLDIKNHPNLVEENPILGQHPSDAKVIGYFAATGLLHWAVTRELVNGNMPRPLINAFECVSIGVEAGFAAHNYSIGLRMKF